MLESKKILIIDSHQDFSGYLSQMLEKNFAALVSEVKTMFEVNAAINQSPYDIVFIDMGFSDMNSMILSERINNAMPNAAIMMMNIRDDSEYLSACFSTPAKYFINKANFIYEDFISFIHTLGQVAPAEAKTLH